MRLWQKFNGSGRGARRGSAHICNMWTVVQVSFLDAMDAVVYGAVCSPSKRSSGGTSIEVEAGGA